MRPFAIRRFHEKWKAPRVTPTPEYPPFLGHTLDDFEEETTTKPPVNIKKKDKIWEMTILLPGFKKEEIEVTVQDDILTIRAEHKISDVAESSNYVLKEYEYDVVERKFQLKKGIGHEKIDAKYENGVLTLSFYDVPTNEEEWFKKVPIQ
ncbi:MAG: Hsp20/alpha crystallin family protein [Bacteroidetes bacterium]|nr:MAG: Hsp20/alpha crystallin family protein [Bacteroidota bacterium]